MNNSARTDNGPNRYVADGPLDLGGLSTLVSRAISDHGGDFLHHQRWFGDKLRGIEAVTIADLLVIPSGDSFFALAIWRILFDDEGEERYFAPLALTLAETNSVEPLALIDSGHHTWRLVDALSQERFRAWLLDQVVVTTVNEHSFDQFRFASTSVIRDFLPTAKGGQSRLVRTEQSNSSVIYNDALILKLFRRLQPGLNPDLEIGRFLTDRTGFRHMPVLVGEMNHTSLEGLISLGMFQSFVPSLGDGWSATLDLLAELTGSVHAPESGTRVADGAELLGTRTGQMHVALAGHDDDPAFSPTPATDADTQRWAKTTLSLANGLRDALDRAKNQVAPDLVAMIDQLDLSSDAMRGRIKGFTELLGYGNIRVHGDYHLGQVLRTVQGDFVILDFEGEPSRPIAERREKTSALKDVAGMLRSFRYARGAALRACPESVNTQDYDVVLRAWERTAREAFLRGYQREVARARTSIVPRQPDAFAAGLLAWELDKALYELRYELNNRPDWLEIPVSSLLMADA